VIAYCPECGGATATQVIARHELSVCPHCDRIFFRNPKVVVTALIEEQGRVLLVRRDIEPGRGLWGLPGGYVDWDEHPEQAMVRECLEETGARVDPLQLLSVQHVILGEEGIVILSYRAQLRGGDIEPRDEVQEVGWFKPEGLPPLAFASHRRVLQEWAGRVHAGGAV
jgi:ADP-ribose pyrophosphatase YjhB (NUDIX family)